MAFIQSPGMYGTNSGKGSYSEDGINWVASTFPSTGTNWFVVGEVNGYYVSVLYNSNVFAYSSDGVTWTAGNLPVTLGVNGWAGASCLGKVVVTGGSSACYTSDGINWTAVSLPNASGGVCESSSSRIVTISNSGTLSSYSDDGGATWTVGGTLSLSGCQRLCWNGTVFIAVDHASGTYTSPDGVTWTAQTRTGAAWGVAANPSTGTIVATFGSNTSSTCLYSTDDGVTWNSATLPSNQLWMYPGYDSEIGLFATKSYNSSAVATSPDGITWTARTGYSDGNEGIRIYGTQLKGTIYSVSGLATSTTTATKTSSVIPAGVQYNQTCSATSTTTGARATTVISAPVLSGVLTPLSPATTSTGSSPINGTVSPDNLFVYVANYSSNTISQFSRNTTTGLLTALSPATVATGSGPRFVKISPDGLFAYVTNYGSASISQFSRNATTGKLTALSPASFTVGTNPQGLEISPDGLFVYAGNAGAGTISQMSRNTTTGLLTALSPATIASANQPWSITMSLDGANVYASCFSGLNAVRQFSRNPTTGLLSVMTPATVTVGSGTVNPHFLCANYINNSLYVVANAAGQNKLYQFSRDLSTGALTALSPAYVTIGGNPQGVTIAPDGLSVYSTDYSDNKLRAFYRDTITGLLTAMSPTTVSTGAGPYQPFISPDNKTVYVTNAGTSTISQFSRTIAEAGTQFTQSCSAIASSVLSFIRQGNKVSLVTSTSNKSIKQHVTSSKNATASNIPLLLRSTTATKSAISVSIASALASIGTMVREVTASAVGATNASIQKFYSTVKSITSVSTVNQSKAALLNRNVIVSNTSILNRFTNAVKSTLSNSTLFRKNDVNKINLANSSNTSSLSKLISNNLSLIVASLSQSITNVIAGTFYLVCSAVSNSVGSLKKAITSTKDTSTTATALLTKELSTEKNTTSVSTSTLTKIASLVRNGVSVTEAFRSKTFEMVIELLVASNATISRQISQVFSTIASITTSINKLIDLTFNSSLFNEAEISKEVGQTKLAEVGSVGTLGRMVNLVISVIGSSTSSAKKFVSASYSALVINTSSAVAALKQLVSTLISFFVTVKGTNIVDEEVVVTEKQAVQEIDQIETIELDLEGTKEVIINL